MTDYKKITLDTYNKSAKRLAEHFKGIGPRVSYIELAWQIAGRSKDPKIVEIGCGDGRDAKAILERTPNYVGFDVSEGMIKIARQNVPDGNFQVADATTFNYPNDQDIVYAFASILHLDQQELKLVIEKVYECLKPGGVFYISSKYADEYTEKVKHDEFGERLFYLFNPKIISEMVEDKFEVVTAFNETRGHTRWFEIALRKRIK